ncbi:GPP34 family phosphoprotein [Yimella sp. RIT 621]|uniref:GOLPH3/VPS74 family protein n=1 Tax=Yimella sp. RIT 621 TaxID=2510323 RepID=UPI00101CCACF|nr:GPP34 family phosphoprotein [Yimella sp. RIT 621]RYG76182.1 GPP34 family phosphoprotein [Yimella sp. RIT 621]
MMPTTDQLFMLLTKDDGKIEGMGAQRGYGLVGAMLSDLIRAGKIDVTKEKQPRLTMVDGSPTGDPVVDHGLARIADKHNGKKLSSLISDRKLNPESLVVQRLAANGVVEVVEKKALGFVPERYPVLNPQPEQETRTRLAAVLSGSAAATSQDATLLSILQGLDVAHKVLEQESGGLGKRDLKARIEQVAAGDPGGDAVSRAIQALNTAMMTAVIIPVVVSGSS